MAIYEAIGTIITETDVSSVEFTSIPSTYEHLELITSMSCEGTGYYESIFVQYGTGGGAADSGTNYANGQIWSYYSSIGAGNSASNAGAYQGFATEVSSRPTLRFGTGRSIILDYANANKNCTSFHDMGGAYYNTTSNYTEISTNVWDNTGAVDRIKLIPYTGSIDFLRGSTFSLYGIKSS